MRGAIGDSPVGPFSPVGCGSFKIPTFISTNNNCIPNIIVIDEELKPWVCSQGHCLGMDGRTGR